MSNQTHREPEDLAKKRREYLRLNATFTLTTAFMLVLVIVSSVVCGAGIVRSLINAENWSVLIAVSGMIFIGSAWAMRYTARKVDTLPYVLPVHEQIAALPAEEVLVRASDQPAATPEELLRAAQATVAEPAEELLRAEEGKPT